MKFTNLKSLVLLCFVIVLFSKCSKDNPDTPNDVAVGTVTVKIDGVDYQFDNAIGQVSENDFVVFVVTNIFQGVGTLTMWFVHPTGKPIKETTYEYNGDEDCDHFTEMCGLIGLGGTGSDSENGNAKITFTSIDHQPGGHATGIFSGVVTGLIFNGSTDQEKHILTEGKFNVKIED